MECGATSEPNGICHPYEDFVAASKEAKMKREQTAALGYDPESTQFPSRKQKAKLKRMNLREKEMKLPQEEWVDEKYSTEHFRETIKLYCRIVGELKVNKPIILVICLIKFKSE